MNSIVLSCPKCGASFDENALKNKKCSYCDSKFVFSSIQNLTQLDRPLIEKHLARFSQALRDNPNDCESLLSLSLCYLHLKMHDLAQSFLERFRSLKPEDPSASFYLSLCIFKGRRPFKSSSSIIQLAEKLLTTCTLLDPTDGKYYFVLGIIKQDYYLRNGLRCSGDSPSILREEANKRYTDWEEVKSALSILDCEECFSESVEE